MKLRTLPVRVALAALTGVLLWIALSLALRPDWELRIADSRTGAVLVAQPVKAGDTLFFGWEHSLEKIPWNEWYIVTEDATLLLETMSFPAFGAGIPADKGDPVIRDGMIYYESIHQEFPYLQWLNSPQTKDIVLNDQWLADGVSLPDDAILKLSIERK